MAQMASSAAAPAAETAPENSFSVARFFALLVSIIAILVARKPDSFLHPQFFCEDAVVFYRDQLLQGAQAIFTPYNGYLHLFPRLSAWFQSLLPAAAAPLASNALGVLFQAL